MCSQKKYYYYYFVFIIVKKFLNRKKTKFFKTIELNENKKTKRFTSKYLIGTKLKLLYIAQK